MHKHKVTYRAYIGNSKPGDIHPGLSGRKELIFEYKERLYYDGPAVWKRVLTNIIKQNEPSIEYIYDDMKFEYLGDVSESNISEENKSYKETRRNNISNFKKEANDRDRELDSFLSKNKVQKSPEQIYAERQVEIQRIADKKKSDQEFFQNMKKYWFIWIPLLAGFVIWFNVTSNNKKTAKDEAVILNQKLEIVEDSIKIAIQNNKKDKALELINQLNHPSHLIYEGKGELFTDEYYDTYWNKKREDYKKMIFLKNSDKPQEKEIKESVAKEKINDVEVSDRESDSLNDVENIPEEYRN